MTASPFGKKEFHSVLGVRQAAVASGIRHQDKLDLVLLELAADSTVAGVFTRNAFCAAPVAVAKSHLTQGQGRYFLINTGNANAGTGATGEQAALACCKKLAQLAKVETEQVLPFSTGVIGEPLPVTPITAALPAALAALNENNWPTAAQGIMTTDTQPKLRSTQLKLNGKPVNITGIAKGAGMLKPNMATMLAFVCTDAALPQTTLHTLLQKAANASFNRITVDGDTSTNDACILAATGHSGIALNGSLDNGLNANGDGSAALDKGSDVSGDDKDWKNFSAAVLNIFQQLAQDLIRDAEGASKFITITVSGGATNEECFKVAYTIAESPLVKTACFASDPNWGRILAAIGRAGLADLDIKTVEIYLGKIPLVQDGGLHPNYSEAKGQAEMTKPEINIHVALNRGKAEETVWTSDLSYDYVRINAEYRT
ncbi:MAG: bifunctional glutamate N-acetyltransferase/amino-acid acetyltransferase ArgJ [Pseudohongiellaceae bacterium]